jgi:hypothetical protein
VDVKELLVNGITEIIELKHGAYDILALNKKTILCSNYYADCLSLLDKNFKLIRKIDRINGENFQPLGLACTDNRLYIADGLNHRIIMTDFEFNKIKSIGSLGSDFNKFNGPRGICLQNEILYICDILNQRIKIYSKDLEFIKSVKTYYQPWLIKATDSLLFIQSSNTCFLFIYELDSLVLKKKIENPVYEGRFSVINSNLYRFNSKSKSVLFYDENGDFKEEIVLNNIDGSILSNSLDGVLVEFNGNLIMTRSSTHKLFKFMRKK